MEDYMIGKALHIYEGNVVVDNVTPQKVLQADRFRYSVLLNTNGAANVWIKDTPDVGVGNGMVFKTQDHHLDLCVTKYGDFVRGEIWVIGAAVGPTQVSALAASFSEDEFKQLEAKYG